jgi:hypothetical protein
MSLCVPNKIMHNYSTKNNELEIIKPKNARGWKKLLRKLSKWEGEIQARDEM